MLWLHNFIIDYEEEAKEDNDDNEDCFSEECLGFITANPDKIVGTFGNGEFGNHHIETHNERPTNLAVQMREAGINFRNESRDKMVQLNLLRLKASNKWYCDQCNHTRM